jgi:Fe-S-cluster containining protein
MAMPIREAVARSQSEQVREEVHAIYAALMSEIAARRPRCDASGRCCHFDRYGHRLYVTTAELATFLTDLNQLRSAQSEQPSRVTSLPVVSEAAADEGSCPFLMSNSCSVHTIRPFGCRIYYCDPSAEDWMRDAYARFHTKLKDLHDRLGLSYCYVEWRQGLRELGESGKG